MLKLSWKGVLANKGRLLLTAIAIVLGVAFVSGSYVFTDTLKAAFDVLFEQEGQENDLVVRAETEFDFGFELGTVPEELLGEVQVIDGVETAVPLIQSTAQLIGKEGKPLGGGGPPTLGFSWVPGTEDVSALNLRNGTPPTDPTDILIDAYTADEHGFVVGDPIDVVLVSGVETFEVAGIVSFGDADNLLGATIAAFELETAQRVFDLEGRYSQISIMVADGVEVSSVQQAIAAALPDGTEVITGQTEIEEGQEMVDEGVGFFNTFLLAFAFIAIFVGGFIIQNTYRIIVAQRTKELAMMRAVGATGRQVTVMVVVEALMVGIVASAIGIAVGILIAFLLKSIFGGLGMAFPEGPLTILPRTVVWGMVVGIVITLLAALMPAIRAARIAPLAALRDTGSPYSKSLVRRAWLGAGVLGAGLTLLLVGLFTDISNGLLIVGLGAVLIFLGVSVLAPLIARGFGRVVGAPLPAMFGVVGRLAQENSIRKPRRTAATASALMIGVALVSIIATLSSSFKGTLVETVGEEVIADFQVQPSGFVDPAQSGVSPALVEDIRVLPDVDVVSIYRVGAWRNPETLREDFLMGVDAELERVVRLEMEAGSYSDLGPGTVGIWKPFAEDEDLAVGDTLRVEFNSGAIIEPTIAFVYGAELFSTNLLIPMETYEEHFDNRLAGMAMLTVADGVAPNVARPTIEALVDEYPNLEMNDKEQFIDVVAGQIDVLLNVVTLLLVLAIIIAGLGIMNTMALSIMERRREIGLLRAVGMSRRQVRRVIRWESVLIALFGVLLGIVVGTGLGAAIVIAIGQGLGLTLPWSQLAIYLVLAALLGVAASLWPAWRGSKVDVLEAIAYE